MPEAVAVLPLVSDPILAFNLLVQRNTQIGFIEDSLDPVVRYSDVLLAQNLLKQGGAYS